MSGFRISVLTSLSVDYFLTLLVTALIISYSHQLTRSSISFIVLAHVIWFTRTRTSHSRPFLNLMLGISLVDKCAWKDAQMKNIQSKACKMYDFGRWIFWFFFLLRMPPGGE